MRIFSLLAAALLLYPHAVIAGSLELRLTDAKGQAVEDAVVTAHPASGIPKDPISFPWGTTMVQQNIAFAPHVLIVPVGATVRFPNRDKVRHHIYSFSRPAKFEMKLFGKDETRSYTFSTEGAVALGCNIHDSMSGFIKVVDTPFAAKSNHAGAARLAGLPAGFARITIWHPKLRGKDNEMTVSVPVTASGNVSRTLTLALRP
jgi:plastocyanin